MFTRCQAFNVKMSTTLSPQSIHFPPDANLKNVLQVLYKFISIYMTKHLDGIFVVPSDLIKQNSELLFLH